MNQRIFMKQCLNNQPVELNENSNKTKEIQNENLSGSNRIIRESPGYHRKGTLTGASAFVVLRHQPGAEGVVVILKRICPPPAYSINAASKLLTRQLVKSSKDKRRWQNSPETCQALRHLRHSLPSISSHPQTLWSTRRKRNEEKRWELLGDDSVTSLPSNPLFSPSVSLLSIHLFLSIFSTLHPQFPSPPPWKPSITYLPYPGRGGGGGGGGLPTTLHLHLFFHHPPRGRWKPATFTPASAQLHL